MEQVEAIVIGAGVVGLAVARALALQGREVVIIEAAPWIGSETSSRNNEVIHAGFLAPVKSLKGRLGRSGRDSVYAYCAEHGVPHRRIGKLLIATDEAEAAILAQLKTLAEAHGVEDVIALDAAGVRELEPEVRCIGALYSPSTGIVDAHSLMLSYLGEAEDAGAALALDTRVLDGEIGGDRIMLRTRDAEGDNFDLSCRILINAAGLGARDVALALDGASAACAPEVHLAKGNFFALRGTPPFRHLVVPLARTLERGGAFTLDLAGRGKFGPDVEWIDAVDYGVDPARVQHFAEAVRRWYPDIDESDLHADYAGVRPRLHRAGEPSADWVIRGPADHSVPGLIHLFGIESPGLTASLAIADHVLDLLHDSL